jgi:response regulator RpfG family c-di-GMP phosphodiesterase
VVSALQEDTCHFADHSEHLKYFMTPRGCSAEQENIVMTHLKASTSAILDCETGSATRTPPKTLRVLIVDDEPASRRMLAVVLSQIGIRCTQAESGDEALRLLRDQSLDAVISDLRMPGMSGMELLEEVRRLYPHTVFLVVTGTDDIQVGIKAMQQGADDYLVKPFQVDAGIVSASLSRALHKKHLEEEIESYRRHLEEMVAERTQQLQEALSQVERSYDHTLEVLGAAIDLRDSPTAGHSRRVFLYSLEMAKAVGGLDHQLKNIAMGAWLHDIGKLAISDSILLKPGPLTDEEREIMQGHVQIGYDLVKGIPFLADAAEIIYAHHERGDGSGYPRGLMAAEIPMGAKIFAIADTFDAMTSDRPYRRALPFAVSREVIERGAGKQYDQQVANTFLRIPEETWEAIRRETAAIQSLSLAAANDIQELSKLVKSKS